MSIASSHSVLDRGYFPFHLNLLESQGNVKGFPLRLAYFDRNPMVRSTLKPREKARGRRWKKRACPKSSWSKQTKPYLNQCMVCPTNLRPSPHPQLRNSLRRFSLVIFRHTLRLEYCYAYIYIFNIDIVRTSPRLPVFLPPPSTPPSRPEKTLRSDVLSPHDFSYAGNLGSYVGGEARPWC